MNPRWWCCGEKSRSRQQGRTSRGIERWDNRTSVILVGMLLDYLEIATEHINIKIIRNLACA
jgi:hypothetical protein